MRPFILYGESGDETIPGMRKQKLLMIGIWGTEATPNCDQELSETAKPPSLKEEGLEDDSPQPGLGQVWMDEDAPQEIISDIRLKKKYSCNIRHIVPEPLWVVVCSNTVVLYAPLLSRLLRPPHPQPPASQQLSAAASQNHPYVLDRFLHEYTLR